MFIPLESVILSFCENLFRSKYGHCAAILGSCFEGIKSHQVHNQDVDGREVRIGLFESLALHLIRINDFNFFLSIDYSLSAKDGPNAFWTTTLKAQVMSFSCI